MNRTTAQHVLAELDAMGVQEWRPESRAQFARILTDMEVSDAIARAAVAIALHSRPYRPTVAEFERDVVVARQQAQRARQGARETDSRQITDFDRAAVRWYAPRLKAALESIGDGPTLGMADACARIDQEFRAAHSLPPAPPPDHGQRYEERF